MVARRTKAVSENSLAKARALVASIDKRVRATRREVQRIERELGAVVVQEQALLDQDRKDEEARRAQAQLVNPPTAQPVDIQGLLAAATRATSRSQEVQNVRAVTLPDGTISVRGYVLEAGKRVQLRGYEIWTEQGERRFFWSLKSIVDAFIPEIEYESHYGEPRPPEEHLILAWVDEKAQERERLKAERAAQKRERQAKKRVRKKRALERARNKLEAELEAAKKLLKKLERELKAALKKLERLLKKAEKKPRAKAKPKAKAKAKAKSKPKAKVKPKVKAKAKAKPKTKAKTTAKTKAKSKPKTTSVRSKAASKGWETRRREADKRSRAAKKAWKTRKAAAKSKSKSKSATRPRR